MGKRILILGLILVTGLVNAQNYKFGKVSIDELQEKYCSIDSSANASVLYKSQEISYSFSSETGFSQVNKIHERIKIYNKEGFDWATKRVPLFNRSNSAKEILVGLKGYTYNLVENKIKSEKLKKNGIFEEKKNKYWKEHSFTLPNIKEGCVIEYTYDIKSPLLGIDDIDFQYTIPIKKLNFNVRIPEYFVFTKYQNPRAQYIPEITTDKRGRTETIYNRADAIAGTGYSESTLEFTEEITKADLDNVPALKKEVYVDNIDNYRAKMQWEYIMFKGPRGQIENYGTNWDAVTKTVYKSESFGGQLNKGNYFKQGIDLSLSNSTSKAEKVARVFNHVKQKVKWNGFTGVYTSDGVKNAYKKGTGNVAEINLMLTAMLRYIGVNANPILISTKSNGIPLFPTREGFNYVVCGVEIDNDVIMLDGTQSFASFNNLPDEALNWQGRIVRANGSSTWVNLLPKKVSSKTSMISVELNENLEFIGKFRSQKTNYLAYDYRKKFYGVSKEDLIKAIKNDDETLSITNLEVVNGNKLSKPILEAYDFVYEEAIEEIGSEIFIDPLLYLSESNNVFNQEKRNYPIDFKYPISDKTIINLKIPDGYKIKSFPKSEKIEMRENLGDYSYLIQVKGNTIQVSQTFTINSPIIPASYYHDLRNTYKKMITKNAEKIVLERI